ncbi:MAG TPA: triose-phosphate isomerase [Candidatus Paceibacterota bacterium]
MTKKNIVIGNWKMNPLNGKLAEKLFTDVAKSLSRTQKTEVVICPPDIYLDKLAKIRTSKIKIGAQDAFPGEVGAYTGEVSGEMLYGLGARYVILGHSERRALGETNVEVNKKIKAAISAGLVPVVCVGESVRDEKHEYLKFIKAQIEECFSGVSKNFISKALIAYEPIWAIGKGALREATEEEFREMSVFIRKILSDKFGAGNVSDTGIIYGGSVHPENSLGFLEHGRANGFLVGRDSLNAKKFEEIVKITENLK